MRLRNNDELIHLYVLLKLLSHIYKRYHIYTNVITYIQT
ncbi:hypothetical protein [Plasmodium yoelii yoelii]|uniref:Uncharacterized protein n=1 Tax=Plasmodium yoelii yoelii TaxID=73239 RepID=Q7R827_PLAYO|nr:hypothetical protein [Plasmodium yoelii yoelii]